MLGLIFLYEECAKRAIAAGADIEDICELPVHELIGRAKSVSNENYHEEFAKIADEIKNQIDALIASAEKEN
jgi:hypothetical protein